MVALVLLVGRVFSGNGTLDAEPRRVLASDVVGYDAINAERGLHGGDGVPVEEWSRTGAIAHARASELLTAGRAVVVDDTSSPRFLRDPWRRLAQEERAGFLLVHVDAGGSAPRRRLAANRSTRTRPGVLDAVLQAHLRAFEPPQADEPHLVVRPTRSIAGAARAVARAISVMGSAQRTRPGRRVSASRP